MGEPATPVCRTILCIQAKSGRCKTMFKRGLYGRPGRMAYHIALVNDRRCADYRCFRDLTVQRGPHSTLAARQRSHDERCSKLTCLSKVHLGSIQAAAEGTVCGAVGVTAPGLQHAKVRGYISKSRENPDVSARTVSIRPIPDCDTLSCSRFATECLAQGSVHQFGCYRRWVIVGRSFTYVGAIDEMLPAR